MPEPAGLYEILQVHPSARPKVIQAAYGQLAQIYRPEGEPSADAAVRMAEIDRAYAVLNDPQWRAAYDGQRAGDGMGGGALVLDVVRAKSFRLVNDAGQTRAELSLNRGGDPVLLMNGRNGEPVLELYEDHDEGVRILLNDHQGNFRLVLAAGDDGASLNMLYENNNPAFEILQEQNSGHFMFWHQGNPVQLEVRVRDDGTPSLVMAERDGGRRFVIPQKES